MLDGFAANDPVAVGRAQPEFSEAPGFVGWLGCRHRAFGRELAKEIINSLDIPVGEVGVISKFTGRAFVCALTEHDAESITGQKAPTLSVDRILFESENVDVVTCRHIQITDCQYTTGIDYFSHVLKSPG